LSFPHHGGKQVNVEFNISPQKKCFEPVAKIQGFFSKPSKYKNPVI